MAPFFGIARPGVYNPVISGGPSAGEFAASGDPDAAAYIAAVEAADGQALEDGVKDAIYDFVLGCKADGIWDAIKSSAILAGARTLNGALVPLVGTAPTNNNFVSGDYNRLTGLAGDGLTKYLDSNRANNADPQNDKHASVYVTTPGADGPPIGSNNFGITGSTVIQYDQSFPRFITRVNAGGGGGVTSTASTASFIGVSRDNASSHIFRFNNTSATISYASQTPSSSNVKVFYDGTTFYSGAVRFYSIGESIDLALLDARVSTLMSEIISALLDPDAAAYIAAVEAADGQALEDGVKIAINDFIVGCKTDGTWNAIKSSAILAGARTLAGALQPLAGTAPTNFNFVSGDYNRKTGLKGDGSTKYLDSNRANDADPQNSNHNAVYVTALDTVTGRGSALMAGGFTETGSNNLGYSSTEPNSFFRNRSASSSGVSGGQDETGLFATNRSNGSSYQYRFGGVTGTITQTSETPDSSDVLVFSRSDGFATDARLSFYSIGESLDLAALDARVSALMTAIDGAIP